MTITRNFPSGAWQISWFDDSGHLVTQTYYGYTKRESVALARAEGAK